MSLSSHDHGNCELCDEIEQRVRELEEALRGLRDWGEPEFDHPALDYVSVQIDRCAIEKADAALAKGDQAEVGSLRERVRELESENAELRHYVLEECECPLVLRGKMTDALAKVERETKEDR